MAAIDGATNLSFIFYHSDEDAHSTMEASVEVLEAPHSDYGLYLWPSGEVLAWYLWKHPEVVRGRRVLELGCGVALPGLLAAKHLGAQYVALTDRQNGAAVLANAEIAVKANGMQAGTCVVRGLSWGCFDGDTLAFLDRGESAPSPQATGSSSQAPSSSSTDSGGAASDAESGNFSCPGPGFDVVLGADCFYSSEAFDSVLATAHWVLHRPLSEVKDGRSELLQGDRTTQLPTAMQPRQPRQFLVTYQERSAGRNVRSLLKKWRLRGEAIALHSFMPSSVVDDPRFASIHMLILTPILEEKKTTVT